MLINEFAHILSIAYFLQRFPYMPLGKCPNFSWKKWCQLSEKYRKGQIMFGLLCQFPFLLWQCFYSVNLLHDIFDVWPLKISLDLATAHFKMLKLDEGVKLRRRF